MDKRFYTPYFSSKASRVQEVVVINSLTLSQFPASIALETFFDAFIGLSFGFNFIATSCEDKETSSADDKTFALKSVTHTHDKILKIDSTYELLKLILRYQNHTLQ